MSVKFDYTLLIKDDAITNWNGKLIDMQYYFLAVGYKSSAKDVEISGTFVRIKNNLLHSTEIVRIFCAVLSTQPFQQ